MAESESMPGNYSSCCRLCLNEQTSSLSSIYDGYADPETLVHNINVLLGVQVSTSDKLSIMLCKLCYKKVNTWDDFKKSCLDNQKKLQQWLTTWQDKAVRVKDEPVEEDVEIPEVDDVEELSELDQPIVVKAESMQMDNEFDMQPPQLSPPHIINNGDSLMNGRTAALRSDKQSSLNRRCTYCRKLFSNVGNRIRHERVQHKARKQVVLTPPQSPLLTPMIKAVHSGVMVPNGIELDDDDDTNATGFSEPVEQEKIEFAAGLSLQSKLIPVSKAQLTLIEKRYLEKCQVMITMFINQSCCCHNQPYSLMKKLLSHLRAGYSWFPPYTCYNCLVTFDGRSTKMRHTPRCPRLDYEQLIRISEMRARQSDKIRIYQNFLCTQCNYVYGFFEDYCEHVDTQHVEESPHTCLCQRTFESSDEFRQHIHKSCFLKYSCDVCFALFETEDAFTKHSQTYHDDDDDFQFMTVLPEFDVMTNIEINNMLLDAKKRDAAEKEVKREQELAMEAEQLQKMNDSAENVTTIFENEEGDDIRIPYFSNVMTKCPKCEDCCFSEFLDLVKHLKSTHNIISQRTACDICGNEFTTVHNMLRHRKSHEQDKPLRCPQCPEKFTLSNELKEHIYTVHSTVRNVRSLNKCLECGEIFKLAKLLNSHMQESHNYLCCDECEQACANEFDLAKHKAKHFNSDSSNSKICLVCSASFATDRDLDNHIEQEHSMETEDAKTERTYDCTLCNKSYARHGGLWIHNRRVHGGQSSTKEFPKKCDECDRVITTRAAYINHKQMHARFALKNSNLYSKPASKNDDSDYHVCKRCFKVFASKSNLKSHMKVHGIIPNTTRPAKYLKTFWCDVCHQACQGIHELNRHKQEHVNEESSGVIGHNVDDNEESNTPVVFKPVYCKYCKIPFRTVNDLNHHMVDEHEEYPKKNASGKNRYPCEICKKVFPTAGSLSTHAGWHSRTKFDATYGQEIKPKQMFQCISCPVYFDNDTSLQLHILEAHRNIDTTIYRPRCKECNVEFNTKAEQDAHEKFHMRQRENKSGVLCKFCNKVFSRSDYLNIHISKQHPEFKKPGTYKCMHCDRVFDKQNALTIHLKMHERDVAGPSQPQPQPSGKTFKYSCSICFVGFDIPKELRQHIITSHPF